MSDMTANELKTQIKAARVFVRTNLTAIAREILHMRSTGEWGDTTMRDEFLANHAKYVSTHDRQNIFLSMASDAALERCAD